MFLEEGECPEGRLGSVVRQSLSCFHYFEEMEVIFFRLHGYMYPQETDVENISGNIIQAVTPLCSPSCTAMFLCLFS